MNEKINDLTEKHAQLYNIIGEGKENAQTRRALALRMGCGERTIRKLIEDLSTTGLVVCNVQDGVGYYKPNKAEDFEAMINIETSRAEALLAKIYGIKLGFYEFLRTHKEAAAGS